ncbi:MAG: hypothetical protein FJX53_00400 [Alphaproteobacteria bacterium]|nr:hypothetical protein [Alphaproteobacteria bacterium]
MRLVAPTLADETSPGDVVVSEPLATAEATTRQLRKAGADVVIALASLDRSEIERLRATQAVDVVVASQRSERDAGYHVAGDARGVSVSAADGGNQTPVIDLHLHRLARDTVALPEAGATGEIDLDKIDPDKFFDSTSLELVKKWRADVRVRDTAGVEPDQFANIFVAQHYAILSRKLNTILATVGYPFDTERKSLLSNENAFANFVTDTMRERTGADIAFINARIFRPDRAYARDEPYTYRDLLTALPVRNRVVTMTLSGRRLAGLFEDVITDKGIGTERFLQESGVTILYDPARRPGERICRFLIGNEPLVRGTNYTIATTDFVARSGQYAYLRNASRDAKDRGDLVELLSTHLHETGLIEPLKDAHIAPAC